MASKRRKNFDKTKLKSKKSEKEGADKKKIRKVNFRSKCSLAIGNKNQKKNRRTKKSARKMYTPEAMKNAVQAYESSKSLSMRTIAKTYGVPVATLSRKLKTPDLQHKTSGPPTVLNSDEEKKIVQWIFDRAAMGIPVTKEDLFDAVEKYVTTSQKNTPFIDNRPGRHWFEGFKRRHPNLTIRTPQHLSHRRAEVHEEDLRGWFKEQENYLRSKNLLNISPTRVFNCDETNVALCPKSEKILTERGSLSAYKITDDGKEGITVLIMYSAAGTRAPPMVMFSYKENLPKAIVAKMPKSWGIGISDNGWMTVETFYEYITNIFYSWLIEQKIEFPVILYLDNHSSHLTMPLVTFCREKQIELIGLYPNATHIMQPLDIAFFHPLKEAWKKMVPKWKNETNMKQLKKEDFGMVLKRTLDSMPEDKILQNGFRACGLVPFDPNAVDYDILAKRSKSKQPVRIEDGEKTDEHLKMLEENITQMSPGLLQQFETNLSSGLWTGDIEYKALFDYWFKVKSSTTDLEKLKKTPRIKTNIPLNGVSYKIIKSTQSLTQENNSYSDDHVLPPESNDIHSSIISDKELAVCTKDIGTGTLLSEENVSKEVSVEDDSLPLDDAIRTEPIIEIINVESDKDLADVIMNAEITYAFSPLDLTDTQNDTSLHEPFTKNEEPSSNEKIKENSSMDAGKDAGKDAGCNLLITNDPQILYAISSIGHTDTTISDLCTQKDDSLHQTGTNLIGPSPPVIENTTHHHPVIEDAKENSSVASNCDPAPKDFCNTLASNEKDINSEPFKNVFTLPTNYLPKKKRSRIEKSDKAKLPAAATSDAWFQHQLEKEQKQKLKEEKLAQKKKLQEEKKKLALEKKLLQEKMNEIQKKIKQETK